MPVLVYQARNVNLEGVALASLDELRELQKSMMAIESNAIIDRRFNGQFTAHTARLNDILNEYGQVGLFLSNGMFALGFNGLIHAMPTAEDIQGVVPTLRKGDLLKVFGRIKTTLVGVDLSECRILEVWRLP